MKITAIRAYRVELPLHEGTYRWSGGNSVAVFNSTVVAVETDQGITGYGEVCPLGPAYLPAYAEGARAGIREIGPKLLGLDPRDLGVLNRRMDAALRGHPYVKSAIDVACWDILGKAANLPVVTLLGGRYGESFKLYRAISQEAPEAMAARVGQYRSEGYSKFQLKVGGDADTDIERIKACAAQLQRGDVLIADANTGWLMHQAARVVDAVKDVDVYIEQPCMSYEECRAIRERTARPFILDEVINSLSAVLKGYEDRAMDVINLKILELETEGARWVMKRRPDAVTIFVTPPSFDELERRLRERATESTGEIDERLELARKQMAEKDDFDHVLVNDDVERAVAELMLLIDRPEAARGR